jgi:hypothetical protein
MTADTDPSTDPGTDPIKDPEEALRRWHAGTFALSVEDLHRAVGAVLARVDGARKALKRYDQPGTYTAASQLAKALRHLFNVD